MTNRIHSLGIASDILAMSGESVIEHYPDRFLQRSPSEPNFWFGNRAVFRQPPDDAKAHIARFRQDFPTSQHICLSWDCPDLDHRNVARLFKGTGLEVDKDDVLTLTKPLKRAPVPEGIVFRTLVSDAEWTASEEIGFADLQKKDYPQDGMQDFLRKRTATRRVQIARNLGQWFGAFDDGQLVGDMGAFHDQRVIRFQSVQTLESHRRRGICAAMLCHVLDWAQARARSAIPVIVAEADSDAGRLYRRAGFALSETMISAIRPPK